MFHARAREIRRYDFSKRYAFAVLMVCYVDLIDAPLANLFLVKAIADEEYTLHQGNEFFGSLVLSMLKNKLAALQGTLSPPNIRFDRIKALLSSQDEDERAVLKNLISAERPRERLLYQWLLNNIRPTQPTPTILRRVFENEERLVQIISEAFKVAYQPTAEFTFTIQPQPVEATTDIPGLNLAQFF